MGLYGLVFRAIGLLCGVLIGAVALLITADVTLRNTGLGSIPWALEGSEYALFLVAILGAPWVLYRGGHVAVDVALRLLPEGPRRAAAVAIEAIGLLTSGVLSYYSVAVGRAAWQGNARVIKAFIFPEWWIFAVMALAALLLAVEFARRLGRAWRGLPSGAEARPL